MMYFYSQRGVAHAKRGIVNQDAAYSMSYNGVHALAIADGVGSCQYAHAGSKFVVEFICKYACTHFEELVMMSKKDLRSLIMTNFIVKYAGCNIPLTEALSTLLLVVRKDSKLLLIQIGDGKILCITEGRSSQVFPDDGLPMNVSYTWESEAACFEKSLLDLDRVKVDFMLLCTDGVYKPDKAPVVFNSGLSYLEHNFTVDLYCKANKTGYQNYIKKVVTASDGNDGDFDDKTAGLMVLR